MTDKQVPLSSPEIEQASPVLTAKGWLAFCIVSAARNYNTERRVEFFEQADAAVDALILAVQQHAIREQNDDGAGLIHQVASPLVETLPRPNSHTCHGIFSIPPVPCDACEREELERLKESR